MKKITLALLLSATMVAAAFKADAQTAYLDAETMAQGHLLYNTDHYSGYLESQVQIGTDWETTQINWQMTKDLWITNMSINGTNIPLSKPLGGIPVPDAGYQNVFIHLNALDKNGNGAEEGQLNTNSLNAGDSLSVPMFPQFPPVFVPIAPPSDPSQVNVTLTGANGWSSSSYDAARGGVTIQVGNIVSTDITYKITDTSGKVLAQGSLPFFQGSPSSATNSIIDPVLAGGVIDLSLGTNGYNYANGQQFDCHVLRSNAYVPAKVFQVSDVANQSKLYVYANGLSGATIELRKWVSSGAMPLIPSTTTTDPYGDTTVITSNYVNKVVITVLPPPGSNTVDGFYIYTSRD